MQEAAAVVPSAAIFSIVCLIMEYRSLREGFQSLADFLASIPEPAENLVSLMDQALFLINHLVVRSAESVGH